MLSEIEHKRKLFKSATKKYLHEVKKNYSKESKNGLKNCCENCARDLKKALAEKSAHDQRIKEAREFVNNLLN